MKDISHKQAVRLIHLRLDGLLNESQRHSLDEHLVSCDSCRDYAAEMDTLPARLQNEFQVRWDRNAGPSHKVLEHVTTKARRIPVTNRIASSLRLMASGFLVALLIVGINFVILQMKNNSTDTIGTQSVSGTELINNRLIAFTSEKDGNFDIYTMHADGSNLTNLTNNPAQDANPVWSPDGKHIAFESDRAGTKQIYLMNSDGSNIVQLTNEEVDHQLPVTYDSQHSIWSSDGSKILFLQNDQDGKTWTLSSINIKGENKTTLFSDTRQFVAASWSPTGNYIGLALFDEPEPDRLLPNLYVIDADGNNLREIRKFLSNEEHVFFPYVWSSDGQSVIFPADKFDPYRQTIYELRLSDNTLTTLDMIQASLFDWYDGIALTHDFNIESQPLVWLRPDGTTTTLDYLKGANPADCYIDKERSLRGNLAIGSYCKQDDKVLLYWTNADGSNIQQLPDLEVPVVNGGLIGLTLSPDEKFVTLNFESDDETKLYIWNMEEALKDSSVQPIKLLVGKSKLRYIPAWQPMVDNDILEEKQTQTDNRLIAFTSQQDGNFDIYTMHADGSGLTNITNNSAFDSSPFWSPDGKRIAFMSDRDGSSQIYIMKADGSNVVQLTSGEGNYGLDGNGRNPWSPDGRKLILSHVAPGENIGKLQVMNITDKSITTLTNEPGHYIRPSWSLDGKHIAFTADTGRIPQDLFVVASDGNGLTKLTEDLPSGEFFMFDYEWSQNGMSIFFTTDRNQRVSQKSTYTSTVYEASMDGSIAVAAQATDKPIMSWWNGVTVRRQSEPRLTWLRPDGSQSILDLCPENGQLLGIAHKRSYSGNLIVGSNCSNSGWMLYWANPDGTTTNQLLNSPISTDDVLFSMTWSPEDRYLAFVSLDTFSPDVTETLYVLDVAKAQEDPSIQPLKMPNSVSPSWQPVSNHEVVNEEPTPAPTEPVSQNELIAFVSDQTGDKEIYTVSSDGTNLKNITQNPALDINPVWSPDGKSIAFESSRNGSSDIYVMNFDGSNVTRLTDDPASDTNPVWSPDGTKIIYVSGDLTQRDTTIYIMDSNGQNHRPLTSYAPKAFVWSAEWSPDNQFIFFDYGQQIIKVNINSGEAIPVTPFTDVNVPTDFVVSTDGSQLSYLTNTCAGQSQASFYFCNTLKTVNIDGTNEKSLGTMNSSEVCTIEQTSTWRGSFTKWSPDRTKILFLFSCEDSGWIYIANADGSGFKPLTNYPVLGDGPDNEVATADWSSDSQSIVFTSALETPENVGIYTLNVNAVLEDPSMRPQHLANLALASSPAWQPQP